jgi:hypothetical protein
MARIAFDIPAAGTARIIYRGVLHESCFRAHLYERSEAAPQSQVRPSALPCKAWWPAAALLLIFLAALAHC